MLARTSASSTDAVAARGTEGQELAVLAAAVVLAFASIGMIIPVLPIFLKRTLHAGDSFVGIVMGLHAAVAVIGRPLTGRIISRRGPQRVLAVGCGLIAAGSATYAVTSGAPSIILSRVVVGVGDACAMIAGAAWAISLAPSSRRGRVLGLFGLASWLGLTLGPAVGATVASAVSITAVWWAACGTAAAGLAVSLVARPPRATAGASRALSIIPRSVLRPGAALALGSAGYAMVPTFIVLLLRQRGSSRGALVLTLLGAVFIVTRVTLSPYFDRWRPSLVAAVGATFEAAGLSVIAVGASPSVPISITFVGAALVGAGASVLYPSLALIALGGVTDADAANALGAFTACWDAGLAMGAALLGVLSSQLGYQAGYLGGAVLALLSAAFGMAIARPRSERAEHVQASRNQPAPG